MDDKHPRAVRLGGREPLVEEKCLVGASETVDGHAVEKICAQLHCPVFVRISAPARRGRAVECSILRARLLRQSDQRYWQALAKSEHHFGRVDTAWAVGSYNSSTAALVHAHALAS